MATEQKIPQNSKTIYLATYLLYIACRLYVAISMGLASYIACTYVGISSYVANANLSAGLKALTSDGCLTIIHKCS